MVKRGASGGRSAGLEVRVSAALEANVPAANDFGASPRAGAGQTPITKLGLRDAPRNTKGRNVRSKIR
jgi:hypothetical protein